MKIIQGIGLYVISLFFALPNYASTPTSGDYAASPSQGSVVAPTQIMLVMPVDQQLFKRAYSDYTDLNNDGSLDTTYQNGFDYLGYFDSNWCYRYDTAAANFYPVAAATGTNNHLCRSASDLWSGNFMNWISMSRMDIVRLILFGGARSVDTSSRTVLRKADSSLDLSGSWAKVYEGGDIGDFTPFSIPVTFCNLKDGGLPTIRVANGSWPRWALTEVSQCQWGNFDSPTLSARAISPLKLQVEACVSGKDASNTERCRQYPSGNHKPVGILQQYGENEQVHFGLMSGSYARNSQGGVLRKNIGPVVNNTNASNDEINLSDGTFKSGNKGIVYHTNTFNLTAWRNPLAEIYLEAVRYFSGNTFPTSTFSTTDSARGLTSSNWVPSLNSSNACANCAIIVISSGTNEFDRDDLGSSSNITGIASLSALNSKTNDVANLEGLSFPGSYFYGGSDYQCTLKSLSRLSDATGICPDAPHRGGGYALAGLSYHALTSDLRTDLDGIQNVNTYTIQLADTLPSLTITANGNQATFQPLGRRANYRDVTVNGHVPGEFGDFTFFWEDTAEFSSGNDYDSSSRISYCIGSACNDSRYCQGDCEVLSASEAKINLRFEGKNTTGWPSFSYSIFGTNDDGVYSTYMGPPGSGQLQFEGPWSRKTYQITGANSGVLPNPLQLAAKYGGFNDLDNNGTPEHDADGDGIPEADSREWDIRNNTEGSLGADGIPDNFFFARNPALLRDQIEAILRDISSRISAGSSAALVSNSSGSTGTAIQALFRPTVTIDNINISWVGLLHSLFIDENGHLREDSNGNATLDDYATDKAVTLFYDSSSNSTVLQRYSSADNGQTLTTDGSSVELSELNPIWSTHEQLMELSNSSVLSQRTYSSPSSNGRHILTWIDDNNNGEVDLAETLPFTYASFTGSEGYLGVASSETEKLIKFIRGEDQSGYRSRSVDYDNDGLLETWRLGDIIHSTPVAVATPKGYYSENRSYNSTDPTFITFRNQYQNRRQVIYVGSNDGMIHAINGGFWDEDNNRFLLTNGSGATSHPLGGEIWAYTPMNLLPHLRWLSEPGYPHVYYMDGAPLIFDANIFTPDSTHPGGWGTVLVMGMRLGGGPIEATIGGTTQTMRSAYVVMDITDPEQPPKLLAEITHPELGFTTAKPVVIQRRSPDSSGSYSTPSENKWYLTFGSGPIGSGVSGTRSALDNASSDQNMKVFIYDLNSKSFLSGFSGADSGVANSYAGEMSIADWNNDFYEDAIYFGSIETGASLSGRLMRLNLSDSNTLNWSVDTFMDVGRPISAAPTTVENNENERWVFAGTGRELIRADSRNLTQEYFFGVKEPFSGGNFTYGSVAFSSLVDTTDAQVQANGNFASSLTIRPGTSVSTFDGLIASMKSETGWVNRLEHNGTDPAGKNLSPAVSTHALLLFTEYVPPQDQCQLEGVSYLQALHYQTGTAIPANTQIALTTGTITDTTISTKRINIGAGLAPAPTLHYGADGKTTVITQGGAGNISSTDLEYRLTNNGRQSWRQIFNVPK